MSKRWPLVFLIIGVCLFCIPFLRPKQILSPSLSPLKLKDHWIIPIPLRLDTLNPQKTLSGIEKTLGLLTFSRLVRANDTLETEPDLLEIWSYDISSRKYTFTLKPGVFFHDGKPVTSDDVIFSFHRWAAPNSLENDLWFSIRGARDFSAGKASSISGIRKVDNRSFTVELTDWVDSFMRNLSLPRFCVYPNHFNGKTEDDFFKLPVGTGPYRIVSYDPMDTKYEAFSKYHFGVPKTREIEVRYLPEKEALAQFKARKVDNLSFYDLDPGEPILQEPGVQHAALNSAASLLFIIPADIPATRSREVRIHLANLVDREQVIRECYSGSLPAYSLIPQGMLGSHPGDAPPIENLNNVDKAAARNALSSLPPLTIHLPEDLAAPCMHRTLTEQFRGTPIKIAVSSFHEMYRMLKKGELHLWVEFIAYKNEDPISILQYFNQTSNEYFLGVTLPGLQALFNKLNSPLLEAEKARTYQDIDHYLLSEGYVKPLAYVRAVTAYRSEVHGIEQLRSMRFRGAWHEVYVEDHD